MYKTLLEELIAGTQTINTSAATLVLTVVNRVMNEVNGGLNAVLNAELRVSLSEVKKLIADFHQLDNTEIYLLEACLTDPNQIFYKS